MNILNKTILITGGGSGIGLEIAKLLSAKGNKVLIIGRNGDKLRNAAAGIANVTYFAADITSSADIETLSNKISAEYSDLSVLINNAANTYMYRHSVASRSADKATEEFAVNYFAVLKLTEVLLPILKMQPEAAVVNVTSIVAFSPATIIPTYSDSKAALHSYTLALRHELKKDTAIKVYELMPPLVNTEFSKDIGGEANGMPAEDVAQELLDGIYKDVYEIHVGQTKDFRGLYLSNPGGAFDTMNAI